MEQDSIAIGAFVSHRGWLRGLVFVGGMTGLGVEMAASRLLAPFFGTSLLVWANLIGLILVYLAVGAWLGGRLADRYPDPGVLYGVAALAGFLVGLVPFIAHPILTASLQSFFDASVGLFVGSLLATVALLAVPVTLLGTLTPFAARLSLDDVRSAGRDVGGLVALSTAGSIVGVFLAVLVLIPALGTRRTFLGFGMALLGVAAVGLLLHARRRASLGAAAGLASLLLLEMLAPSVVRPGPGVLFEGESPYHFVQVLATGRDRWLALNEGQALHSWYNPDTLFGGGIWDSFAVAPLFARAEPPRSLAVIGLAAGTVARQYNGLYGPLPIVGVEIDPLVVEVGERFFDLRLPNLTTVVADGRTWLQTDTGRYDVLIVDAYRQPYIPFHLTTVEFFAQARDRLGDDGALVVNVGHSPTDTRLVDALAATLRQVFPSVYIVAPDGSFNSLLVATNRPTTLADYEARTQAVTDSRLRGIVDSLAGRITTWQGTGLVLTDDRAPVEQITDQIILRYALTGH